MPRRDFSLLQVRLERILWALVLLLLPVSSFRFLPFFGESQVRPLSFIPAVLLLLSIFLRSVREKRLVFWNPAVLLLLVFTLAALISTALGAFLSPQDLYQFTYTNRVLRAWVTLLVGLIFILLPVCMVRSEQDLKFSLKWIFIGLAGHFVWAIAQWVEVHITSILYDAEPLGNIIDDIQKTFSMAGIPGNLRISGLALEPSWLAAQMTVFYLPWIFAGIITGYAFSKKRWLSFLLLVPILLLTLFSYSRTGIIIILLAASLTLIFTGKKTFVPVRDWFLKPFRSSAGSRARFLQASVRVSLVLIFVLVLVGGGVFLARNKYFSALWQTHTGSLVDYLIGIYAGPRLAFSWAGWEIFTSHPWFGVGLGASGFYIHAALPDWAHFNMSEVSYILSSEYAGFPNVKSLYLRILSELGILGFWLWIAFYLYVLSRILSLLRSTSRYIQFAGLAGLFIWFSTVFLNFTMDSFAMPLIWLPFGMILGLKDETS